MSLRFAIVGCGRIGSRHANHIQNQGTLVAVCDIDQNKSRELASEFNCRSYTEIEELLTSEKDVVDVVSICSPNGLHAQHSIKSLKAGFHVICEKPMALSSYDCGEMIKQAELSNKRLFIVKQNRFNPPVVALKELLENNRLGKVFSIQLSCFWNRNEDYYKDSWKGSKELDGGTLFTQFSHFIDLLYWLFGDVEEVQAQGSNYNHKGIIEFEDTGVLLLKFKSGALGSVHYSVNSYRKNMEGSLTVLAEKGTVKVGGQYLNELEYQNIEDFTIEDLPEGNSPNNYGQYQGSMSNHDKVYQNVIQVLTEGASIATNGFEGLKTVEIIEKAYSHIRKNETT
tara:strand:+ start:440 stop:1459 length:1020 start_codon:yes stop_codon:yes gene_type:complete